MEKRGRPTKFTDALAARIMKLAEKGLTMKQIAAKVGVSPRTLFMWQATREDFMHTLKESKSVADELVVGALFSRAVGYSHEAEKIFCSEGMVVRAKYIEHYPPDVTAGIFWLKNRQPDQWRNNPEPKDAEVPQSFKIGWGDESDGPDTAKEDTATETDPGIKSKI